MELVHVTRNGIMVEHLDFTCPCIPCFFEENSGLSLGYSWTSDWANGSSTCNKDLRGVQSCDEWMPDFVGGPDLHVSSKVRKLPPSEMNVWACSPPHD